MVAVAMMRGVIRCEPPDDLRARDRPEIAAVEGIGRLKEQEDLIRFECAALVPARHGAAFAVDFKPGRGDLAVDDDRAVKDANVIARDSGDALDQWHAKGQIAAFGGQFGDGFWRRDKHEVAAFWRAGYDAIKADWRAGRGVPDQTRRVGNGRNSDQRDARNSDEKGGKGSFFHHCAPSDVEDCRRPSDQSSRSAMW